MVEIKSCFLQPLTSSINCNCIRALPSDVSNAKYLTFDTPNTTIQASWGVLNVSKFYNMLQYSDNFGTVQNNIAYEFIIFLISFLSHPN